MGWADGDELPVTTEIYVGGAYGWVDITDDTRLSQATSGGGITITRGRNAEGTVAAPGRASLVVDNASGDYSDRNPRGQYYGLIGRNTPIRVGITLAEDGFDRTESGGWGTADSGQEWFEAGGSSADFAVSAGTATIAHPTDDEIRWVFLGTQLVDVEQVSDIATSAAVTGAGLVTGHIARYEPVSGDCYWLRLEFSAGSATVTAKISKWYDGNLVDLAELVDVPDLTYSAGDPLRMRTAVVDGRLSIRIWDPDGPEPRDWTLTATDTDITDAGYVGIMTWVVDGNTNSPTLTVSVSDYQALDRRAVLEVLSWPPRWNGSETDKWVPIAAAGVLQRLSRARRALRSALYRLLSESSPLAYWPMEDGTAARRAASGIDAGTPMTIATGSIDFQDDGPPGSAGSAAVVEAPTSVINGTVLAGTAGAWQASVWCKAISLESEGVSNTFEVMRVRTTSTRVSSAVFALHDAGSGVANAAASVSILNTDGAVVGGPTYIGPVTPAFLDDEWHLLQLTAVQDGSDVDLTLYADGTQVATATITSATTGIVTSVAVPGKTTEVEVENMGVAHIAVHGHATLVDQWDAGQGYAGETAGARLTRLGEEQGIPMAVVGDPDLSAPMGPQRDRSWYDLVAECAAADMGILGEAGETLGLAYRTRASLYNQAPVLEVDYSAGHLAPPLEPDPDDFEVTNDVTVSRVDGSSARAVLETGRLSILDPPDGIGTGYDTAPTINAATDSQLADMAGWLRHLGTWDEERYPALTVLLHAEPWRTDADLTALAAALDAGRVLELDGLPDWVPPGPIRLMAQGYTEIIDAYERSLTWSMEPAGPYSVGVVEDDVLGRADTDGSELAADFVAGTDTSMSVSITDGPLGITTADHASMFPFDIYCGGVVLEVLGISGASSPMTFSVSASVVNGVEKTIPAGTPVSLAHPWRAAL